MRNSHVPTRFIALLLGSSFAGIACAAVTCSVSSAGVSYGVYDPLSAAALDSNGTLSVTCSIAFPPLVQTVNYTVGFSTGSGSMLARRMTSGANQLNYNLYTTSSRNQVWGDGNGSTAT